MEQKEQQKQRNARIEALLPLARLMVIMMHVRPALLLDRGVPVDGALLMQTLAAPGVGLFF